jgi:hypothetical protein
LIKAVSMKLEEEHPERIRLESVATYPMNVEVGIRIVRRDPESVLDPAEVQIVREVVWRDNILIGETDIILIESAVVVILAIR